MHPSSVSAMDVKGYSEMAQPRVASLPCPSGLQRSVTKIDHLRKSFLRAGLLVVGVLAVRCLRSCLHWPTSPSYQTANGVEWSLCGDNFQCANISVPLDYHNTSDERMVTIAVTRYLATDKENRWAGLRALSGTMN